MSVSDLVGISYFPFGGFQRMWAPGVYNGAAVAVDLAKLSAAGFNTVRIFLGADPTQFAYTAPGAAQLSNLTDTCKKATGLGLRLQFCLFDSFGNFGTITHSETWVDVILGAIAKANIASGIVEIGNELPFASTAPYVGTFDTGWTGSMANVTVGQAVSQHALAMTAYLRTRTGMPITVSTTDSVAGSAAPTTQLPACVAAMGKSVNWLEWHLYPARSVFLTNATQAKAVCNQVPLRIGETGMSVDNKDPATFFQIARQSCVQLGLPVPAPWAMYDISTAFGNLWGLWDPTGAPRPPVALWKP